jgi:hypothetical protein
LMLGQLVEEVPIGSTGDKYIPPFNPSSTSPFSSSPSVFNIPAR